jgi:hypothetical protein
MLKWKTNEFPNKPAHKKFTTNAQSQKKHQTKKNTIFS